MKLTIDEVVQRINQVLNYPSVSYEDVYHFFDHAIAELNTVLKTDIPSVSDLIAAHRIDTTLQLNTVLLPERPVGNTDDIPTVTELDIENCTYDYFYHVPAGNIVKGTFYVRQTDGTYVNYDSLYGIYVSEFSKETYVTVPVGSAAYWSVTDSKITLEFDLCDYMPSDWWTLFVIPYVCFKFSVRDGDDGALYSTEFTQGLQQLQTSYDVPNTVTLSKVAHLPAYADEVKNNLNNLAKRTVTKAITYDMRVGNAIAPLFDTSMTTGGWGV